MTRSHGSKVEKIAKKSKTLEKSNRSPEDRAEEKDLLARHKCRQARHQITPIAWGLNHTS